MISVVFLSLPGKSSNYNPEYQKLSLFNNEKLLEEFKEYSLQDSICFYDCIYKLQEIYLNDYNVYITSFFSTSTVSMQIFRRKFLKVNIPILKRIDDAFIREGVFRGVQQIFIK
jgi:hypothetical protein